MGKKLFVGNLAFSATESTIHSLFSQHGSVESCRLIMDRETGRSKGFAFVEMSSDEEAQSVISTLDGHEVEGRALKVNEARPQVERSSGGFGGSSRGDYSNRGDRGAGRSY